MTYILLGCVKSFYFGTLKCFFFFVENCKNQVIKNTYLFFSDLNDQRDALIHMNGFYGMGPKPIRVALAIPKRSLAEATNMITTAYSDMYESYYGDTSGNMANYGAYQVKG